MLAPPVVVGEVATATASQPPKDLNTYRRTKRGQNTKVPHSGGSPKKAGDEAINEEMLDSMERAITTDASLEAAQDRGYIPGGDEGRLKLKKLMTMCTKLSKQMLDLEKAKDAQAVEILKLKKQGRSSDKTKLMFKDSDFDVIDAEQITTTGPSHVSTADQVSTARPEVSAATASTPPTTITVFDDEDVTMAMAQTLIKMKEVKAKEKGVEFRNVEEASRPVRSITTLQPLPKIDPKDKGKSVLVEEEPKKVKIKDQGLAQIESDAELAQRLHEEELAEIDVDALFAAKLQQEERKQFTIKERAQFLVETIAAQRKFRAAQRAAEIRSGYKHSQLKGKTYEEIHELYEIQQKRNQDFIPMDSEKETQKSGKRLKRVAGSYTTQKSPKKLNVMKSAKNVTEEEAAEYEKEKEELGLNLKIISGDDSEVNYELLSRRFPIVNWEYMLLGNVDAKDMYVYKLTRADGSSSYHGDMQAFLRRLDRSKDINMLVENKYPLIKELLEKMLNLQLEAEEESNMAFELIKFIKSMLEE
ncbi:hypothetical protein Tco_1144172 [Tanacetum coccineum]